MRKKITNLIEKWAKNMNLQIIKEKIQMANKSEGENLTSIVI